MMTPDDYRVSKNPTKEYEVIVKTGRYEIPMERGGGVCWGSIKTYFRIGRWGANMKANEERNRNPTAVVIVRALR
jgi:hypothetical protein